MHPPGTLTPEVDNPSPRRRSHPSPASRRVTFELDPEAERSSHEEPQDLQETDDKRASVDATRRSDEEATSFEINVIDRITDEATDSEGRKSYLARCYGKPASLATWEPIENLPRIQVISFCRRKRLPLPASLQDALVG